MLSIARPQWEKKRRKKVSGSVQGAGLNVKAGRTLGTPGVEHVCQIQGPRSTSGPCVTISGPQDHFMLLLLLVYMICSAGSNYNLCH